MNDCEGGNGGVVMHAVGACCALPEQYKFFDYDDSLNTSSLLG